MCAETNTAAELNCPLCKTVIGADDMDKGVMVCPSCGHQEFVFAVDDAKGEAEVEFPGSSDSPAAAPTRPSTTIADTRDDLTLSRRRAHVGSALFLLVLLCGWSAATALLVGRTMHAPSTDRILFAIPFVTAELGLLLYTLYEFFAIERLRISRDGMHHELRAGLPLGGRTVPLNCFRGIRLVISKSGSESKVRRYGLVIVTTDGPIKYANGADPNELLWLNDIIRRRIAAELPAPAHSASTDDSRSGRTVLRLQSPPPPRPTDRGIRLHRKPNRTSVILGFQRRAALKGLVCLVLANLFCSGIVAPLAWAWFRHFSWVWLPLMLTLGIVSLGAFLLLAAFIGLALLQDRYVFTPEEARVRSGLFGLGRARRYDLARLARLEMGSDDEPAEAKKRRQVVGTAVSKFKLVLVSHRGEDLLEMGGLNESDARWLGNELLEDFHQWRLIPRR